MEFGRKGSGLLNSWEKEICLTGAGINTGERRSTKREGEYFWKQNATGALI